MPIPQSMEDRQTQRSLVRQFVDELLIDTRSRLHRWRSLTNQPAQIDTGYVAQHLVSVITGIPGGGFRGKGDDLSDGSEIKAANFLDAFDDRGSVSPRWNLSVTQVNDLDKYLKVPHLYLVLIDLPPRQSQAYEAFEKRCVKQALTDAGVPAELHTKLPRSFDVLQDFFASDADERLRKAFPPSIGGDIENDVKNENDVAEKLMVLTESKYHETAEQRLRITNACRIRVWRIDPRKHELFRRRYEMWMDKKARPKFDGLSSRGNRQDANFQIFPPRNGTNETFARHGSTRSGELPPVHIRLQDVLGAQLVMGIERDETGSYTFH